MREACAVINAYWFGTLARSVMPVPKAAANQASRRVSKCEGMRLVGLREGHFVGGLMDVETWEMTRAVAGKFYCRHGTGQGQRANLTRFDVASLPLN